MTYAHHDAGYRGQEHYVPPVADTAVPRPLRWEERFPGIPADEASPYCGQLFAAQEASALEFVAYLVDRRLLSEWPEEQQRLATDHDFETWFSAWQAGLLRDNRGAPMEETPAR